MYPDDYLGSYEIMEESDGKAKIKCKIEPGRCKCCDQDSARRNGPKTKTVYDIDQRTGSIIEIEVMVGSVGILPYMVVAVLRPLVNPLVEIGSPAEAHVEGVDLGVICVIHMADTHRHKIAAKAHVTTNPGQVAGVVVDVTGSGSSGGNGGVIPVAFQTVVVPEQDD